MRSSQSVVDLRETLLELLSLKRLKRAGWSRLDVENPESVAAHSWGVAWLACILCPDNLDRPRAIEMAVIHDVAESRVGDITPFDGISESEKEHLERSALIEITQDLPRGERVRELWEEYEAQMSDVSRFVMLCDKLDMALQSLVYEQGSDLDFGEFRTKAKQLCEEWGFTGLLDN